jgi:hypothetical protein
MPIAETLGVVGSIIAIVQISKTVISLCQFYIDTVDGASSDLRVILIEVSALNGIAKSLQYLTQPNVANSALLVTDPRGFTNLQLLPGCFEPRNGLSGSKESIAACGFMVSQGPESPVSLLLGERDRTALHFLID